MNKRLILFSLAMSALPLSLSSCSASSTRHIGISEYLNDTKSSAANFYIAGGDYGKYADYENDIHEALEKASFTELKEDPKITSSIFDYGDWEGVGRLTLSSTFDSISIEKGSDSIFSDGVDGEGFYSLPAEDGRAIYEAAKLSKTKQDEAEKEAKEEAEKNGKLDSFLAKMSTISEIPFWIEINEENYLNSKDDGSLLALLKNARFTYLGEEKSMNVALQYNDGFYNTEVKNWELWMGFNRSHFQIAYTFGDYYGRLCCLFFGYSASTAFGQTFFDAAKTLANK